jgi:hypothetical protein
MLSAQETRGMIETAKSFMRLKKADLAEQILKQGL